MNGSAEQTRWTHAIIGGLIGAVLGFVVASSRTSFPPNRFEVHKDGPLFIVSDKMTGKFEVSLLREKGAKTQPQYEVVSIDEFWSNALHNSLLDEAPTFNPNAVPAAPPKSP